MVMAERVRFPPTDWKRSSMWFRVASRMVAASLSVRPARFWESLVPSNSCVCTWYLVVKFSAFCLSTAWKHACGDASFQAPSVAQAEYSWQVGTEKRSRHPLDLLRCPLGRKGMADFPPLAYLQNRNWTNSPFLQSLRSTKPLFVRRSQDEYQVLDLIFVRKRTEWQVNGRSSFVDDRCVQETTKKRNYRILRGGGGRTGVRECAKLTSRERFSKFWISFSEPVAFFFGCHTVPFVRTWEPSAKLRSPNWTLGRKVSHQIDHRGPWSGGQNYFLVANGD